MGGLKNAVEVAREYKLQFFTPSSIGAFGPSTPKVNTPQVTIQRPTSMYGVNKVAGELLCQYYFEKFGVDTRRVRFPGLISHIKEPGGGTTDYAVDIYFKAVREGQYSSFIAKDTFMDMMVKEAIQEYYPDFKLDYDVDPVRQSIADSWPNSIDVSCARAEWGFNPQYDLSAMTKVMLDAIEGKEKAEVK